MTTHPWVKELPAVITVCDAEGTIIEMNDRSVEFFAEDGGAALIGTDVLDCHPEPSRTKLEMMIEKRRQNIYTVDEDGERLLVFQTPWYQDGEYAGFVEVIFQVPTEIRHRSG